MQSGIRIRCPFYSAGSALPCAVLRAAGSERWIARLACFCSSGRFICCPVFVQAQRRLEQVQQQLQHAAS